MSIAGRGRTRCCSYRSGAGSFVGRRTTHRSWSGRLRMRPYSSRCCKAARRRRRGRTRRNSLHRCEHQRTPPRSSESPAGTSRALRRTLPRTPCPPGRPCRSCRSSSGRCWCRYSSTRTGSLRPGRRTGHLGTGHPVGSHRRSSRRRCWRSRRQRPPRQERHNLRLPATLGSTSAESTLGRQPVKRLRSFPRRRSK